MITIEYLNRNIEGEPGPNFYWRGTPDDFLRLLNDMHVLGRKDIEINLLNINYIKMKNIDTVYAISSSNGNILCKKNGNTIIINLKKSIWLEICVYFLSISFYPSFNYVDFDNMNLIEDANFIISSEG